MEMQLKIPMLDLIIIVFYLVGITAVGILVTKKQRLTANTFFLAGRSLRWGIIGAALFASNISTIHLVGLAASGYNEGLVWGNFEWIAIFALILLALIFSPPYIRSKISTLPEFLERRYSSASRTLVAFMALAAALFIHIGMSLYAGAAVFQQFFGIDVLVSIFIISLMTLLYTVLGGLRAVVVTEAIQSGILVLGAITVTLCALWALPEHGIHTITDFKSSLRPNQLSMLHMDSSVGMSWYAVLLGCPVLAIWYWCTDQTIVQRVLAAKSERDAQLGPLFAGCLKILPVFFMVFPGIVGYVLFKDVIGSDSNQTLPVLINELVPTGLRGLISAGILAALMSTIAAALNSSGTLVATDIVKRFKPNISDRKQVQVGRISSVVIMLLAMLWSTQGGKYSSIFEAINAIAAHIAPPITTVFLWGILWRRGTKEASIVTLSIGFFLGAVSFLLDFPVIGSQKLITEILGIHFMMQAWWMFCLCSGVFLLVSWATPPPPAEAVEGITWENPLAVIRRDKWDGFTDPRGLAGILFITLIMLYYLFR